MVVVPYVNHVVHGSVIKPEVSMKVLEYNLKFGIYESYKLSNTHYYIRSLKSLNIKAIDIPNVGWVNIGL